MHLPRRPGRSTDNRYPDGPAPPATPGDRGATHEPPTPHPDRRRPLQTISRDLEAKVRALAGLKGYLTNIPDPTPEFVIGAYHQLWHIEKSFRMSKHDLRARPIYHHKRESIDAHLSVVFAALAITRLVEGRTSWSIKKFVRTARRYRTIHIRAGQHVLTAEDRLPTDLRDALAIIT